MAVGLRLTSLELVYNVAIEDEKYVRGENGVLRMAENETHFLISFESGKSKAINKDNLANFTFTTEEFEYEVPEEKVSKDNVVALDEARKSKSKRKL